MPNIEMFVVEGLSDQQKEKLIDALTAATVEAIDAPIDSIRVWLSEIPATDFGVAGKSLAAIDAEKQRA
ncbi:tautomerase family protein [Herbaspirillum sp. RV1423]|uniref:tautomerase family protein n=1 Tax=Herbaspirillum sp. RV1423 TaxID=1443993 RepID=UPI00054DBD49|nr:tautomerase family protein [Herbaspirillum sp. RV1423]